MMIAIGAGNFFLFGFNPILDSNLGGTIGGILDKIIFLALIGFGVNMLRKRMVVSENHLQLFGIVDGASRCKIEIPDIEAVKYLHGKERAEIATKNGSYLLRISESSNVYTHLKSIKPQ